MTDLNRARPPASDGGRPAAGASRLGILLALLVLGLGVALVFALTQPPQQPPLPDTPSQFVGLVVEVDGESHLADPPIPIGDWIVRPLSRTMEGAETSFLIDGEIRAGRCVIEWVEE